MMAKRSNIDKLIIRSSARPSNSTNDSYWYFGIILAMLIVFGVVEHISKH